MIIFRFIERMALFKEKNEFSYYINTMVCKEQYREHNNNLILYEMKGASSDV